MREGRNRLTALVATLALAAAMVLAAAGPALATTRAAKGKTHQATGEVVSVNATTLVLLHARGRGKTKMTFYLTPETKRLVSVAPGKRVLLLYRIENGKMMVRRIRAPRAEKKR
jgi:hypothetical protein